MAASASPVVCAGFTIDEDDEVVVTEPVFGKKQDLTVSNAYLPGRDARRHVAGGLRTLRSRAAHRRAGAEPMTPMSLAIRRFD